MHLTIPIDLQEAEASEDELPHYQPGEYRGRGRDTNWKGKVSFGGATIRRFEKINAWNHERLFEQQDDNTIVFRDPAFGQVLETAKQVGAPVRIVETVVAVNDARKERMIDKITNACGGSVAGKTIAVLGLTFKPNTDDMRDSPSLYIVPALCDDGATVRAFDPQGMEEAKQLLNGVVWCDDTYSTMEGADCLAIVTEWNEFRALDLGRVKSLLTQPLLVDLRNIYQPDEMKKAGFDYHSVGRPTANGAS